MITFKKKYNDFHEMLEDVSRAYNREKDEPYYCTSKNPPVLSKLSEKEPLPFSDFEINSGPDSSESDEFRDVIRGLKEGSVYGIGHCIRKKPEDTITWINNNNPTFRLSDFFDDRLKYSLLDSLGRTRRCTVIIKPSDLCSGSGLFQQNIYSSGYYKGCGMDRCHMAGNILGGGGIDYYTHGKDIVRNMITGTKKLNGQMRIIEKWTKNYITRSGNSVLYRITPIYCGDELICRGIVAEDASVQQLGRDFRFCVYISNTQPGKRVDYKNGGVRPYQNRYTEYFFGLIASDIPLFSNQGGWKAIDDELYDLLEDVLDFYKTEVRKGAA